MKTIIYFTILLLLIFTGCSTPHIDFNEKTNLFELRRDNKILLKQEMTPVFESRVQLININIYQYVYELQNKKFATYEKAYTQAHYIFNKSIDVLISRIFSDYSSKRNARYGNIYFYTLQSKRSDTKEIYLIVENQNKKLLKLLYTNDQHFFTALLKSIQDNSLHIDSLQKKSTTTAVQKNHMAANNYHRYIKSSWNHKNILFVELLKREGGRIRRPK